MNEKQLKRGNELTTLINTTREALADLEMLRAEKRTAVTAGKSYVGPVTKIYNLSIFEYDDGSGLGGKLARYEGNEEVLDAVIAVLRKQYTAFTDEMAAL